MNYYNKYLKYKTKYLELKYDNSQYGGSIVPCNKGYANKLGTCWAVAIQMIICFGHFTSGQLKCVMDSFNNSLVEQIIKNAEQFIDQQILKIKEDAELTNVFAPYDIFSENKIILLKKILHKFIERYYNKVMDRQFTEKPEDINPKENQERCEKIIAENFKNLFNTNHLIINSGDKQFGGRIYDNYLFCNLLSVFFLDYKVSFTNYYDNFNLIKFNPTKDLGILVKLDDHACCLFICNGEEKFYNEYQVYDCKWIDLLVNSNSTTNNLYIKKGSLIFIDNVLKEQSSFNLANEKRKLLLGIHEEYDIKFKVQYLTVISKHTADTNLDIDIKKFLEFNNVQKIKDRYLQLLSGDVYYFMHKQFEQAIEMYILAANQGNHIAQYRLGYRLANGKGILKNDEEAVKMLTLSMKQNNPDAQYMLGTMLLDGKGIPKDTVEAMKMFYLAAKQDHKEAHDKIKKLEKEQAELELELEKKAANEGNPESQYKMGERFLNGKGVEMDSAKAIQMYRKAADQGNADAQYRLSDMLLEGKNVDIDVIEGLKLLRSAADKHNIDAILKLAQIYMYGTTRTVYQDLEKSIQLYTLGATLIDDNKDHNVFTEGLAMAKRKQASEDAEYKLAQLGAMNGNADSQYNLGIMLLKGKGVARNTANAVEMFQKASDQQHGMATMMLGQLYEKGTEVVKDIPKAIGLYKRLQVIEKANEIAGINNNFTQSSVYLERIRKNRPSFAHLI
jgi:TPR repeat protein